MTDRLGHVVTRLNEGRQQTLAFFHTLEPEQWDIQVYDVGPEWDVRHVLCHFISAEQAHFRLFKNVASGGEGAPADFDIDGFNASDVPRLDEHQVAELLTQFSDTRTTLVKFVEGLSEADLERVGRHPFLGQVALGTMIKMIYRHNMLHQRDIQQAIQSGQPVPSTD